MAVVEPTTVRLRDLEVVVRTADAQDADALLELGAHLLEDGEGQVMTPGELRLTHDDELAWIEGFRSKGTSLLVVAELAGRLVGVLDFYGGTRERLVHLGHFGLGVRDGFRSRGIGRALLSRAIEWARGNGVTEKINLNVLATNARAIALYASLGFVQSGLRRDEIKLGDGAYVDDMTMELLLARAPRRAEL